MKLKSLVAIIAATIVSTTLLMAQQRGAREQMSCEDLAKRRTEVLKKEVKLDEKQAKSAQEIYLKTCKESQEARKNNDREAAEKVRKESTEAINALLTPEQLKIWQEYQKKQAEERRARGGSGRN